jgi:nitroimidazol reductase NimA-like FMN-containing flavoprotein (pyridoxamine 5'-phosphate oxidase superfamily)
VSRSNIVTNNPFLPPIHGSGHAFDRPTCLALLARGSLGRLVFTDRALPGVLPVHYRMDGERILLKLALGSPAFRGARGTVVAFTVDEFDGTARSGWSVTVVGSADEVVEPEEHLKARLSGVTSWWNDVGTAVFSITTEKLTGGRLQATL